MQILQRAIRYHESHAAILQDLSQDTRKRITETHQDALTAPPRVVSRRAGRNSNTSVTLHSPLQAI
jgi:hypothetical protein